MNHRHHARPLNEEVRAERESRRKGILVRLWEDTDVSDIDCTPTYDTSALNEKIRSAQLKCQTEDLLGKSPDEVGAQEPCAVIAVPDAVLADEVLLRPKASHHIDVLGIAESICREKGVPFELWQARHMPQAAKTAAARAEEASAPCNGPAINRCDQNFGPEMMRGEGEAMAAFVASGQRIPRRGEVGWSPEDIERFERSGFVMSGSRNRRITNVRIRKEAQVYSAEQQRALSLYNYEQRAQRERAVAEELHTLLKKGQTAEERGTAPEDKSLSCDQT